MTYRSEEHTLKCELPPYLAGTPPKEGNKKSTSCTTDAFPIKYKYIVYFFPFVGVFAAFAAS